MATTRSSLSTLANATFAALPRPLHPAAWWGWALSLAVVASVTTNPLLLLLIVAVLVLVVTSRRGDSPFARAFRYYLVLGGVIIAIRVVLHILVGLKTGTILLFSLPELELPSWAAGITLGGPVYLEGLLRAMVEGLRLATIIACIGAANALANPKRLLRAFPGALHDIGTALVVAVSVAPQLAESVVRVMRARTLRGDHRRGLRGLRHIAIPVLHDTLERSIQLAASMDARGYGRRDHATPAAERVTTALTLGGLVVAMLGLYGVFTTVGFSVLSWPLLAAGLLVTWAGLRRAGRLVRRTAYRPDPWAAPEWLTVVSGMVVVAAVLAVRRSTPDALTMPLEPLGWPALPPLAVLGLLVAAAPAVLTPPPRTARAVPRTREPQEVAA
ncbi:energy-coupling factor transporter transmembrane component T [Nostocoides sp. F2B08]|uniref:energy-coupling factor transporter transmembrane component T n=1 Tax=Nostocoides sp. F2B08 TaxID=2653936 RepID=UPI001D0478E1|nr:energy-coupling factor transporter transmembrane component T [Tetrasphaera sp. F2B08]